MKIHVSKFNAGVSKLDKVSNHSSCALNPLKRFSTWLRSHKTAVPAEYCGVTNRKCDLMYNQKCLVKSFQGKCPIEQQKAVR
jgi:hypothetical protein